MPTLSRRNRLEQQRKIREGHKRVEPIEVTDVADLARIYVAGRNGELNPTQKDFIFSADPIKWYSGPVGCAKTSTGVASIVLPAMLFPGSRWMVSRWTYNALQETTMKRFDDLCKNFPGIIVEDQEGPPRKVWIASSRLNENGIPLEPAEILFTSLDDPSKFGSLEFNGILVDEANEIGEEMANMLNDRLRYVMPWQKEPVLPPWTDLRHGPYFLSFVSNPVTHSHWLHRKFCMEEGCENPPMGRKFRPQSRENEKNLPPGYYERIARGKSPQEKARFIEGECGPDPSGKPVFHEFIYQYHVGKLSYIPGYIMLRSWDFGRRRPACVWAQLTPEGHLNYLHCMVEENESTRAFAERVKAQSNLRFPHVKLWMDYCDPAGDQAKSNSNETDITELWKLGIRPTFRRAKIKEGLEIQSANLTTWIGGRPKVMVDENCKILIDALSSGYRWPEVKPGHQLPEKPLKDGFYEHPMDAKRYLEFNLAKGGINMEPSKHAPHLRKG